MKHKDLTVAMAYGVAVGMTFGLIVGSVAGALLAPASGAEMRRRLRYERDSAVDAARFKMRRTMTRLRPIKSEMEEEESGPDGPEAGPEFV